MWRCFTARTRPAQAKKIKLFALMASRDALNIDGLSEATLEKFIGRGFIHEAADLFHLDRHREDTIDLEGSGRRIATTT